MVTLWGLPYDAASCSVVKAFALIQQWEKPTPTPNPEYYLEAPKKCLYSIFEPLFVYKRLNFFRYSLKNRKLVFGKKIKFQLTGNTLKGESFKYWKALEVKEVKEERDSDWLETLSYLTTPISTKAI